METYNQRFIRNLANKVELEGKVILEVGCGNGDDLRFIAETYKPKQIIGIDRFLDSWWKTKASAGEIWEVKDGDAMDMEFPDNHFDVVFSLATFEHIPDVAVALAEIKRVLKPFGKFYTEFAPIWTSIIGHHYDFWVSEEKSRLIPPWGHLWMSESEMYEYVSEKAGEEEAKRACYGIYHSDIINRIPRNQFYNMVQDSGLWVRHLQEGICFSRAAHFGDAHPEITDEILMKLKGKYAPHELATTGFNMLLEKFARV